jgi:DNA-binding SARP family transcriptional activator
VQFRVLGPFDVVVGGRSLPLGGPKQRVVLASLALRPNEVVPVEAIVEAVWGDAPPASSLPVVRTYISRLRRVLGTGSPAAASGAAVHVASRPPGYVLETDAEQVDAHRFEALVARARGELDAGDHAAAAATLRRALGLWRGDVLTGLTTGHRVQAAAARLGAMRLAALEDRIDADLALGRHAALVGELEELTTQHPFRERMWGQLVLALYRSGRQADALAAYRSLRATLAEQLGIDPSPQLRALEAAVLRQGDDLERPLPTGRPQLVRLGQGGCLACGAAVTDARGTTARHVESGQRALAEGAFEEAVTEFRSASALLASGGGVDPEVAYAAWYGLATAASAAGRWAADQRTGFLQAASIAREQGWAEHLALAAIGWAVYSSAADCPRPETGDLQGGLVTDRLLDEALVRLDGTSPAGRCVLLAFKVLHAVMLDRWDEARALLRTVDELAGSSPDPATQAYALLARAWVLLGSPHARELRACAERALDIPVPPGVAGTLHAHLLPVHAVSMLRLADRTGFEALRARLTGPDRPPSTHLDAFVHMWDGAISLARGRLTEAVRLAATLPGVADWSVWDKVAALQMAVAAGLRGDHPVVRSRLGQAAASTPSAPVLRAAQAYLDARQGRVADARRHVEALRPAVREGALGLGYALAVTCLAEATALVGATDAADELLTTLGDHSGQLLVSYTGATVEAAADQAVGQVLLTLGRLDEAVDRFAAAEELERSFGADVLALRSAYWQARARLARRRRGDEEVAHRLLRGASSSARRLGLAAIERDCGAALAGTPA